MKEDAESAFENISKNGISLVRRKLRVQWAKSKVRCYLGVHNILIDLTHQSPKTKKRKENPNLVLHQDPNHDSPSLHLTQSVQPNPHLQRWLTER
jgi:hypothetical protein